MRYLFVIILFFIVIINANAQQTTLSTGGNATGEGGSVSYSIGQVLYTTNIGTIGNIAQGVQQPYEIFTLGIESFPEILLKINAYPNPTIGILNLNIENYDLINLSYKIFDVYGRMIQNNTIYQNQTSIDMTIRQPAVYFLSIYEYEKILQTFKIIKN